jgi:hypothetical protein
LTCAGATGPAGVFMPDIVRQLIAYVK